jgi:TolB protein
MTRSFRFALVAATLSGAVAPLDVRAQDTTFRGITLVGSYDPLHDKVGIAVLPIAGAFGDSVRTIIQRDLDFSDRFTVIPIDSAADPSALRGQTPGKGINYPLFSRLAASAVVQITPVGSGLHVVLHDVARGQVVNVADMSLPPASLGRDWRLAVHRTSDEIERWITGQRGIAATRIAYMRGQSIRVIDSDGVGEITVPTEENGASPAWNASGTMLVYATFGVSSANVPSHVVLIDLSTGRSRTIVPPGRNAQFVSPIFSPDGKSVIYAREGENGSDLFAIGIGGGEAPRQLTAGRGTVNTNPTMSPDGRRVVFVSGRLGRPELYIMDSDGTDAKLLTEYDFSEKNYRSDPDWSPDGRLIAYQERINNDRFQIRTIRATGGTPKLLTSEGENEQPSWAPDGRHLVFTSTRTKVRQLWILDTESNRIRQLTKSAGSRLASWSPRLVDAP